MSAFADAWLRIGRTSDQSVWQVDPRGVRMLREPVLVAGTDGHTPPWPGGVDADVVLINDEMRPQLFQQQERYLEHLATAGLADRQPRYGGGGGRPEVAYHWR